MASQHAVEKALFVLTILESSNGFLQQKNWTKHKFQLDVDYWDLFFNAMTTSIRKYLLGDACCLYVRALIMSNPEYWDWLFANS